MIVQCELCATKFKLEDSKVKEEGVRVRCSKCRHIFIVRKERVESSEETDFDSFLDGLVAGNTSDSLVSDADPSVPDDTIKVNAEPEVKSVECDVKESLNDFSEDSDEADFQTFSFLKDTSFTQSDEISQTPFDAFSDLETTSSESQDNIFTEVKFEPILGADAEESADTAQIDADNISPFMESLNISDNTEALEVDGNWAAPETKEPKEVDDNIMENKVVPESEILWAPAEVTPQAVEKLDEPIKIIEDDEVLQPVSPTTAFITSNPATEISADDAPVFTPNGRKRPVSKLLISLAVFSLLAVIILAGVGLYAIDKGPAFLQKLGIGDLVKLAGFDIPEEGGISIRNAKCEFVGNKIDGELFIIKGDVVNTYSKPKGSIQLKAKIYNAKGAVHSTRTVYCGNVLAREQLVTMPYSKIETVLGNQFGDALSNIGVPPGQSIPFMVVFSGVPVDAAEYGLEVVGSPDEIQAK